MMIIRSMEFDGVELGINNLDDMNITEETREELILALAPCPRSLVRDWEEDK